MSDIISAIHQASRLLAVHSIPTPHLDAEVLLAHTLGISRDILIGQGRRNLSASEQKTFGEMLKRRIEREPVAYITGSKEFWGMPFAVNRAVLIPRPDTETLVEAVLEIALKNPSAENLSILEIGTGSGALACALASELKNCRITATDISAAALAVARSNAAVLGLAERITFVHSDLFEAIDNRFAIIAANLPYVTSVEYENLAREIRDYEPKLALWGGSDGLSIIGRLLGTARDFLLPHGKLALEIGANQGKALTRLLQANGYTKMQIIRDLARKERVVVTLI